MLKNDLVTRGGVFVGGRGAIDTTSRTPIIGYGYKEQDKLASWTFDARGNCFKGKKQGGMGEEPKGACPQGEKPPSELRESR